METPALTADLAVPLAPAVLPRVRWRWRRWVTLAAVPSAILLILLTTDAAAQVRACLAALGSVHWGFLVVLAGLSVLHYVFAALSLKGVAQCRLPLGEATLTQFTAAVANRITPGGLGAVAVNTRYLVCRGTPGPRAVTAVAMMQIAGALADLLLLLALVGATEGGGRMLGSLGADVSELARGLPFVPLLVAFGALTVVVVVWGRRALRSAAVGHAVSGVTELLRRPGALCLTLTTSAATTFVLGVALALSVLAVPGTAVGPGDTMTLITAYMIGSAAGAALPSPGGIGGTEAALVATLSTAGIAAAPAIQSVLLFRAITYWAPIPVGLLSTRALRIRAAKDTGEI